MPRGKAGTGRCKPIFRGLNIAISGTFEGQWTDANISKWVNLRAAKFSSQMSEDVTHLVCTKEEFEKKGLKVKEALKRAYKKEKKCHLVTLDWLEDSLFANRRLPEDEFSHVASLKALQAKARLEKKIARGVEEEKRSVNENFYHVYFDPTDCFQYEITLVRDDEEMGILGERYVVKLYESNALPHLYQVGVRYYKSKKDTIPKLHRLTDAPGGFWQEYEAFKRFFEIKVGYPWDERLVRGVGSLGNKFFCYQPPTGGKPVGWTPAEFIPKEPTPPPPPAAKAEVTNIGSESAMSNDQLPSPPDSPVEADTNLESTPNSQDPLDHAPKDTDHEALVIPSQEKEIQKGQTQQIDQCPLQGHAEAQTIVSPDTPMIETEESVCMVKAAEVSTTASGETSATDREEAVTVAVTTQQSNTLQGVDGEETMATV
ncbi:hypothetical protein B0T20DRAFT_64743 [Sordaria brevicollis]|uniref:BRCT domain-containing protein n=1 Tax=Sordaria brevicollis TaxID=83679 RepID=A0AAE0P2F9_SORBR|nr:hypothetical protein B0T20DRAFT_64743 [Sordaria brevicollis]